jgi:hypothetical protein
MKKVLFFFVFCFVAAQALADTNRYAVPLENSPFFGPQDARVTIVEFIDYQ